VAPADEWPWLTSKANGEAREFRAERLRSAPTANGVGGERGAGVARSGAEREPEAEPWREAEAERAAEPAPNGAAAEPSAEPEPERAAEPASNGAVAEPERAAEPEPVAERGGAAEREPATNGAVAEPTSPGFDVAEANAVPRHRFDREAEAPNGRAGPARRGPICQVRWSAPGTCFYAVTTDVNGVEHRLAWSPPIEWRQPGPPDEDSREARAALRVLAKELRDKGWRPMRAKGDDFDEQRWYARRFRFPVVEGDDDAAPWLSSRRPSGSARA
jgi:hypothetical protein